MPGFGQCCFEAGPFPGTARRELFPWQSFWPENSPNWYRRQQLSCWHWGWMWQPYILLCTAGTHQSRNMPGCLQVKPRASACLSQTLDVFAPSSSVHDHIHIFHACKHAALPLCTLLYRNIRTGIAACYVLDRAAVPCCCAPVVHLIVCLEKTGMWGEKKRHWLNSTNIPLIIHKAAWQKPINSL